MVVAEEEDKAEEAETLEEATGGEEEGLYQKEHKGEDHKL